MCAAPPPPGGHRPLPAAAPAAAARARAGVALVVRAQADRAAHAGHLPCRPGRSRHRQAVLRVRRAAGRARALGRRVHLHAAVPARVLAQLPGRLGPGPRRLPQLPRSQLCGHAVHRFFDERVPGRDARRAAAVQRERVRAGPPEPAACGLARAAASAAAVRAAAHRARLRRAARGGDRARQRSRLRARLVRGVPPREHRHGPHARPVAGHPDQHGRVRGPWQRPGRVLHRVRAWRVRRRARALHLSDGREAGRVWRVQLVPLRGGRARVLFVRHPAAQPAAAARVQGRDRLGLRARRRHVELRGPGHRLLQARGHRRRDARRL